MVTRDRFMKTLRELVSAGSISGTVKENLAVDKILKLIQEIPYFQKNAKDLVAVSIENDPLERKFISAMVKSSAVTKDTILITGHLDVVGIEDFGHLQDIAFDIDQITTRIKELHPDPSATRDLETGEWIFGRGVTDMKYGIALCIEILRWFSAKETIPGNLLFLAVPGEESNSEGMLAAVSYLEKLQREGFHFKACFNTESTVPRWKDDDARRIYTGTIGKVMPLFFCRGKESHVCDALSSVNPNLVLSEISRMIENNPAFCTPYRGECNPPPVCLKQTDLKDLYNVQTPLYAAAYYNLLTVKLDGEALLEQLKTVAKTAFENSLERLTEHGKTYAELTGVTPIIHAYPPTTMTYQELWDAVSIVRPDIEIHMNEKIKEWQSNHFDNQTIAIRMMRELCEYYPDKNPLVVVGFAPPFYPARVVDGKNKDEEDLLQTIDIMLDFAKEHLHESIEKVYYYDAICDLSYTGLNAEEGSQSVSSNMPGLGKNYHLPLESLEKLDIPGVVFGGLGRDFHKNTERLYVPYSVDVVPKLYEFLINQIFCK